MSKKQFTDEEVDVLAANPYTLVLVWYKKS